MDLLTEKFQMVECGEQKMINNVPFVPLFLSDMYFFGEVITLNGNNVPFKVFAKDHPEFILEEQLRRYIVESFLSEKMNVKFIQRGGDSID